MGQQRVLLTGVLVVTLALLASCATSTLTTTAQSLTAVGDEFLASAKLIDAAYTAKTIPESDYQKWRDFVPQFQLAYAEAVKSVQTFKDAGASPTVEQQAALALSLKNQLLGIVVQVYLPAATQ